MRNAVEMQSGLVQAGGGARVRVAHLIHTMAYGGVETALLNWIKTIDQTRFELRLFCFSNPGGTESPFIEAARSFGINVETIPWNRRKPIIRASRLFASALRRHHVDVVHCHNTYADVVGLIAARLAGAKSVVTLYVWGKLGFVRNVLQRIDRILLPFFDQVTVHCEETRQGTVERGYPADRLQLLPCGYEAKPVVLSRTERRRRRADLGAEDHNFVLINVARFWPEKAHDVLLRAFRLILEQYPAAQLWLLGIGPTLDSTRALAEGLKLGNSVTFLGFRSDLAEILSLADMQVHPSDAEGVPLAICAGMAAGLPIVASRVGGLPEVIKDGVSGRLTPRRDPAAFAEAVLELARDEELRQKMGCAAARFIEEEYSLRAAARKVEMVYEHLAQS